MELREVLDKDVVQVNLEARDKEDALRKMSAILKRENYIEDIEDFVQDIYVREAEGVTGIGNGVAIPHGKSNSVKRIGIAIAKLLNPIEWETLDGNPVDLIFLFCVSNDNNFAENHMRVLSRVAGRIADDDLLQSIKESKTSQEIVNLMAGEKL